MNGTTTGTNLRLKLCFCGARLRRSSSTADRFPEKSPRQFSWGKLPQKWSTREIKTCSKKALASWGHCSVSPRTVEIKQRMTCSNFSTTGRTTTWLRSTCKNLSPWDHTDAPRPASSFSSRNFATSKTKTSSEHGTNYDSKTFSLDETSMKKCNLTTRTTKPITTRRSNSLSEPLLA